MFSEGNPPGSKESAKVFGKMDGPTMLACKRLAGVALGGEMGESVVHRVESNRIHLKGNNSLADIEPNICRFHAVLQKM